MTVITLQIADGVKVVVPNSLGSITPYVLIEQRDWFEDEIAFVRKALRPGQQAIDIGANYGLYSLAIAKAVGQEGHVWAYEPASATAAILEQSIAVNGFAHVSLEQQAMSERPGEALLTLHSNAEINALATASGEIAGDSELVRVTTLDAQLQIQGWREIDFLKIDAEGAEPDIVKGGRRFFATLSPLVQYEVASGDGQRFELTRHFAELGYDTYRLVPGLGILVPFEPESADGFLLNLFSCKADRAARLANAGLLLTRLSLSTAAPVTPLPEHGWRRRLTALPYGAMLYAQWETAPDAGPDSVLARALALFHVSQDGELPALERFSALDECLDLFAALSARDPMGPSLAGLARVTQAFGARTRAVNALIDLADRVMTNGRIGIGAPFLLPCARFDAIPPGAAIGNWFLAAVLEALEKAIAYSSFYTGEKALERLLTIRDLGFAGDEMKRRLSLVERRFMS